MQSTKTFLLPIYAKYTPSDVRMFSIFFVFVGSSNHLMLTRQRAFTLNASSSNCSAQGSAFWRSETWTLIFRPNPIFLETSKKILFPLYRNVRYWDNLQTWSLAFVDSSAYEHLLSILAGEFHEHNGALTCRGRFGSCMKYLYSC